MSSMFIFIQIWGWRLKNMTYLVLLRSVWEASTPWKLWGPSRQSPQFLKLLKLNWPTWNRIGISIYLKFNYISLFVFLYMPLCTYLFLPVELLFCIHNVEFMIFSQVNVQFGKIFFSHFYILLNRLFIFFNMKLSTLYIIFYWCYL